MSVKEFTLPKGIDLLGALIWCGGGSENGALIMLGPLFSPLVNF